MPSFFQGLRVSPRKPCATQLPKLRERQDPLGWSPFPEGSRTLAAGAEEKDEGDAPPLDLMKDTSWILFPNAQVNQPFEPAADPAQLRPGSPRVNTAELIAALRKVRLFRGLTDEQLGLLSACGRQRVHPRYSSIVREGTAVSRTHTASWI